MLVSHLKEDTHTDATQDHNPWRGQAFLPQMKPTKEEKKLEEGEDEVEHGEVDYLGGPARLECN